MRNTPSSSRPSYGEDDGEDHEDELAGSTSGTGSLSRSAKGKGKQKKNGKLPFKSLPTPVKSSQVPKGLSNLGTLATLQLDLSVLSSLANIVRRDRKRRR